MKTLIKAILKPIIQKLKKSQFIRSLLSENNDRKYYSSFARFIDSSGNTFELLKEIRDEIKPGWRSMFDAKSFNAIPSRNEILVKSESCDARSVEMIELLRSFSFLFPSSIFLIMNW